MTTLTYPAVARRGLPQWTQIVPGTLLLAIIGFAGKVTEQSIAAYGKAHHITLPNIEYVLWAIVFGLIVSNTVGIPAIFRAGVDTYEFWLKAGIVLLGVRFLLGDVVKLGGVSLAVDNTAEATAAGALYSDAAGKFAVLAKTARNATIGFVVLGYALYWVRQHQGKAIQDKAAFLWQKFPKFVLGFIVISALAT